jgi:hypothetical protein
MKTSYIAHFTLNFPLYDDPETDGASFTKSVQVKGVKWNEQNSFMAYFNCRRTAF